MWTVTNTSLHESSLPRRSFAAWGFPPTSGSMTYSASTPTSSLWYVSAHRHVPSSSRRRPFHAYIRSLYTTTPPPYCIEVNDLCFAPIFKYHKHSLIKNHSPHPPLLLRSDSCSCAQVPQPVHAVLLLFPITDKSEKARDEEAAKIEQEGQTCSDKAGHPLSLSLSLSPVYPVHPTHNLISYHPAAAKRT